MSKLQAFFFSPFNPIYPKEHRLAFERLRKGRGGVGENACFLANGEEDDWYESFDEGFQDNALAKIAYKGNWLAQGAIIYLEDDLEYIVNHSLQILGHLSASNYSKAIQYIDTEMKSNMAHSTKCLY